MCCKSTSNRVEKNECAGPPFTVLSLDSRFWGEFATETEQRHSQTNPSIQLLIFTCSDSIFYYRRSIKVMESTSRMPRRRHYSGSFLIQSNICPEHATSLERKKTWKRAVFLVNNYSAQQSLEEESPGRICLCRPWRKAKYLVSQLGTNSEALSWTFAAN